VGIAIVIAAGISSQYHPSIAVTHGNYSECTELKNASSELLPGTYYSSAQITLSTLDPSPTPTISSVFTTTRTTTAAMLHEVQTDLSSTPITPSPTLFSMQFDSTIRDLWGVTGYWD